MVRVATVKVKYFSCADFFDLLSVGSHLGLLNLLELLGWLWLEIIVEYDIIPTKYLELETVFIFVLQTAISWK
jgi:hypothetical protein